MHLQIKEESFFSGVTLVYFIRGFHLPLKFLLIKEISSFKKKWISVNEQMK